MECIGDIEIFHLMNNISGVPKVNLDILNKDIWLNYFNKNYI
jgi:hypothetical protein